MASADQQSLNLIDLVKQKEKEWKDAQELRVKSLHISLKEQENLLNNERTRFRKLKEDFEYNLKLLGERDQELEKYDILFSKYKNLESERDAQVSELKIKLDDLQSRLSQEENSREELQKYYQQRLKEHQNEMQQFVVARETEVKKERDNLEKFKRELQLQLRSAEEDMDRQRHLIMSGYDDELHKRDHEYRIKVDEMSNKLLEKDLKVKMLSKEVEILRSYEQQSKSDLITTESTVQDLEKKLKQKELELIDNENMYNAKVTEKELEVQRLKAAMKKSQDTFQHKQTELDRYAREKESALLASKEVHELRERQLEETIHELQDKLDTMEVECRRLEWEARGAEKDKEFQLSKLHKTVSDLEEKLSAQASKFSQSSVSKDLELDALRQQEEKLRMDVTQKTADIERYKKDVAMAAEREMSQERVKAQIELDWQRRFEDAEREAYEIQEHLIRNLTKTKDEALAAVKEKDRELDQRQHLIRILTQTRDQTIATLQRHGLSVPVELPSKDEPTPTEDVSNEDQLKMYQEQNENLRDVIRKMRQEMEELSNQLDTRPPSIMVPDDPNDSSIPLTSEYVKSLEKEIRELKSRNRTLTKRLEDMPLVHKPPTGTGNDQIRSLGKIDDPYVQTHVKELNDTIGVLRQDKLQLAAECKKHEASIEHLRNFLNQARDQARQKQVAVDHAQYELATLSRRSTEESNWLKQRVSELELLLIQVRREADEYFKNGLERNLEATTLGNQLSVLKLELASQGKSTSSFNPQNELISYRQHDQLLQNKSNNTQSDIPRPSSNTNVARLQARLKTAAHRITQLVREKDQLIQMGNKLRAELSRLKGTLPNDPIKDNGKPPFSPTPTTPIKVTPEEITDQLQTKLNAMEKLQYALTSRELQLAQRITEQQKASAGQIRVNVRYSSSASSPTETSDFMEKENSSPDKKTTHHHTEYRKEPEPALSLDQHRTSSPHQDHALFTSSSEGQASLQEIWKLLDEEESFRSLSPINENYRSQSSADIPVREESEESSSFTVKGKKPSIAVKSNQPKPELSKRALGKMKFTPKKALVRNYNVRDDKY